VTAERRPAVAALGSAYGAVSSVVTNLDDSDFARPTGCEFWAVDALLFHLMLDAQRALIALAAPRTEPADTDAVGYWRGYAAEADAEPDLTGQTARFATRSAAAYSRPAGLVQHWTHVAEAAVCAAARSDPGLTVSTQGMRLRVDDFLETLVVEATIHHLDLVHHLDAASPSAANLALTRATLEALLGRSSPSSWPDPQAVLRLTGRDPVPAGDAARLGSAFARIPVIR
jgi:uncharacterized protein (TIGR03083 family)